MLTFKPLFVLLPALLAVLAPGLTRAADPIPDPMELLLKEVNNVAPQPFCCEITGEHPIMGLEGEAEEGRAICGCETCQRWAFGRMHGLCLPLKISPADKALEQIERVFLGISIDMFAHEQQKKQKADELGVLQEWLEHRYGRRAIWPDRCALTGIPCESSLITLPDSMTLCVCANCQQWAYNALHTVSNRVVKPLAQGEKEKALAALKEVLEETRNAGRDLRANTVHPEWLRQVRGAGYEPFCCDSTGKHPEKNVTADDAGENEKLCPCDSCQRWASKAILGLTVTVQMARFGDTDRALDRLNTHTRMSTRDFDGSRMRQREAAEKLGVLDEWIEYRYGKSVLWPDRCAVTGLYSESALMLLQRQLCQCDNCQQWAFTMRRELHLRIIAPLRDGDKEKALAALKEIAGEGPPRPRLPVPDPVL